MILCLRENQKWGGGGDEVQALCIGRSVRSTTASVIQIPTTTPPIIPNRRGMREVP